MKIWSCIRIYRRKWHDFSLINFRGLVTGSHGMKLRRKGSDKSKSHWIRGCVRSLANIQGVPFKCDFLFLEINVGNTIEMTWPSASSSLFKYISITNTRKTKCHLIRMRHDFLSTLYRYEQIEMAHSLLAQPNFKCTVKYKNERR